ncbi:LA_0442/LA_0875 N-terminal domain-containing protein [Leptospira ilyithenensis]|uniref:Uncharacterized protein n=1 Tax=Leptospira ilyithenensis TaxID=2484901 RepID=A0A4R9LS93_9LEPT|nr:hypothetical protein [Leptospira ilyithenensis]TGN14254.1 hypothetical protein EHS11_01890 [Leptospira ilyithenensis]
MKKYRFLLLFVGLFLSSLPLIAINTILLKNGKSIKGIVSSQNLDSVEINRADGKHVIVSKKSVLKIIYKDLAEEEEAKIRKEEQTKRDLEKTRLLEIRNQENLTLQNSETAKKAEERKRVLESANTPLKSDSLRTSFLLHSPNPTHPILLASPGQKCQPYSEYPEYFWMFGAFRFKEPKYTELFPKEDRPIRISQVSTYKDVALTLLGGFLITVTRKTLVVEICEGEGARSYNQTGIPSSADSELKTKQDLQDIEEKLDLELLEKDLEHLEKQKQGQ